MFDATCEIISSRIHKYEIKSQGWPVSYAAALSLLGHHDNFRQFFIALLSNSEFSAYRWETPPITGSSADRNFEFVLIDSPSLIGAPDRQSFAEHFLRNDQGNDNVTFRNLGGDAMLVVPTLKAADDVYTHLAAFIRGAPDSQVQTLWKDVSFAVQQLLGDRPLWVSTAGGGVAWLHVRLDSTPKYYGYPPYTIACK